jgi:hypothetical protein
MPLMQLPWLLLRAVGCLKDVLHLRQQACLLAYRNHSCRLICSQGCGLWSPAACCGRILLLLLRKHCLVRLL